MGSVRIYYIFSNWSDLFNDLNINPLQNFLVMKLSKNISLQKNEPYISHKYLYKSHNK